MDALRIDLIRGYISIIQFAFSQAWRKPKVIHVWQGRLRDHEVQARTDHDVDKADEIAMLNKLIFSFGLIIALRFRT